MHEVKPPFCNSEILGQWMLRFTRRSENDSTLGRPRSENTNTGWVWPFQIMNHFMVHCIMPPNFRPYCDFLTFPNMSYHPSSLVQAYHGTFQSYAQHAKTTYLMILYTIPPNARLTAEIIKDLERKRRPSDLVRSYHGNFNVPWNV